MKMKYFGFLTQDTIENFDTEEIMNFLVSNQLFEEMIEKEDFFSEDFDSNNFDTKKPFNEYTSSFFPTFNEFMKIISIHIRENLNQKLNKGKVHRTDLNNFSINQGQSITLQPTQNLLDDFYQSYIEFHREKIASIKFTFYLKYGEKIFGLNINEQKAIALKNYKKIYKIIFEDKSTYMPDPDFDDELDELEDFETYNLKVENKLNMVFCQQLKYKHKLSTFNPFFAYLTGDESIFSKTFYNKNQKTIDETLKYEALKEIMEELNNKFEFEENFFINKNEDEKLNKDIIPSTNEVKFGKTENNATPFSDFIIHENKIEIEQIIKTHYSNLKGVSLRYLIEFLREEGLLLVNHGDATKLHNSIKILFEGKDIGAYQSVFDKKVFSTIKNSDYINSKISFTKIFRDFL